MLERWYSVLVRRAARGAALVAIAFLLAAHTLAAQTSPQSDRTVFRAGVDVVRLDVRAIDAAGNPVPDLRPDEVEVIDAGVKQPIVLFQHIAASGRTYVEAAQRTIAGEISTNQGSPRGQLYVLVFDQLHITSGSEQRVRLAAETFLRRRFHADDRVAVFGLPGPGPSQTFTSNLSAALGQLQFVRGDMQRTLTPGDRDMTVNEAYEILRGNENVLERFMTNGAAGSAARTGILPDVAGKNTAGDPSVLRDLIRDHANSVVQMADADSRRFLDMTSQLLRTLRGVDGRKTVMLFSEGFHSDNVSRTLDEVAAAAAASYSVVYAFDLNRRIDNLGSMATGNDTGKEISSRVEALGTLSAETNGRLIIDAMSHLDQALDSLGAAEPDYYVVGFPAPAAALADRDQYRRVTVRVTRPDVRVSARTGYVAGPQPTPADRRRAIDAALTAPFSQQSLRVEYTTYIGQSEHPGFQSVAVSLAADLPVDASSKAAADVVFVVRDMSSGQVVANGSDTVTLPHDPAPGSVAGHGLWHTRFDLPPGSYAMRCIVREPGGLVGSADRQFTVRALAGPDPATSDLVLGTPGDRLPVRTIGYTSDLLAGAVRAYGRSEAQLAGLSATLELMSLARSNAGDASDDHPARSVTGSVSAAREAGTGISRDISFTLPLVDLPAGEYVAHAVIRAGGEVVGDLRRQLQVIDAARPEAAPAANDATPVAAAGRARDILRGEIVKGVVDGLTRSGTAAVRTAAADAAAGRWSQVPATLAPVPPADPEAARLRALARVDRAEYAAAATDLEQLFNTQPDDAALAFVLGWARVGAGNEVGAASAFRSAAFLDPAMAPAHLALAETYLRLKQPALAIQALESGLTRLPQSTELRRMLDTLKK